MVKKSQSLGPSPTACVQRILRLYWSLKWKTHRADEKSPFDSNKASLRIWHVPDAVGSARDLGGSNSNSLFREHKFQTEIQTKTICGHFLFSH